MADSLLENYNPLYDVHLRQYFALPHMQRHLKKLGLIDCEGRVLDGQGGVYARHQMMMDLMLKNREQQLMKLSELQKKLDAAEKVEIYRRIRSGQSPESFRRTKASRSLSRGRPSARGGDSSARVRRFSNSMEDKEMIQKIELANTEPDNYDIRDPYARLSAKASKYRYLHKLDDPTLIAYKDQVKRELDRLERFRAVSFGVHSVARQPPQANQSWFFRRRSLPSLTQSAPANALHEPLRSINSLRGRKPNASPRGRQLNESHTSRTSCPPTVRQRRNSGSNPRLPPIQRGKTSRSVAAREPGASSKPLRLPPASHPPRTQSIKRETKTSTTTTTTTAQKPGNGAAEQLPKLAAIGVGMTAIAGGAAAAIAAEKKRNSIPPQTEGQAEEDGHCVFIENGVKVETPAEPEQTTEVFPRTSPTPPRSPSEEIMDVEHHIGSALAPESELHDQSESEAEAHASELSALSPEAPEELSQASSPTEGASETSESPVYSPEVREEEQHVRGKRSATPPEEGHSSPFAESPTADHYIGAEPAPEGAEPATENITVSPELVARQKSPAEEKPETPSQLVMPENEQPNVAAEPEYVPSAEHETLQNQEEEQNTNEAEHALHVEEEKVEITHSLHDEDEPIHAASPIEQNIENTFREAENLPSDSPLLETDHDLVSQVEEEFTQQHISHATVELSHDAHEPQSLVEVTAGVDHQESTLGEGNQAENVTGDVEESGHVTSEPVGHSDQEEIQDVSAVAASTPEEGHPEHVTQQLEEGQYPMVDIPTVTIDQHEDNEPKPEEDEPEHHVHHDDEPLAAEQPESELGTTEEQQGDEPIDLEHQPEPEPMTENQQDEEFIGTDEPITVAHQQVLESAYHEENRSESSHEDTFDVAEESASSPTSLADEAVPELKHVVQEEYEHIPEQLHDEVAEHSDDQPIEESNTQLGETTTDKEHVTEAYQHPSGPESPAPSPDHVVPQTQDEEQQERASLVGEVSQALLAHEESIVAEEPNIEHVSAVSPEPQQPAFEPVSDVQAQPQEQEFITEMHHEPLHTTEEVDIGPQSPVDEEQSVVDDEPTESTMPVGDEIREIRETHEFSTEEVHHEEPTSHQEHMHEVSEHVEVAHDSPVSDFDDKVIIASSEVLTKQDEQLVEQQIHVLDEPLAHAPETTEEALAEADIPHEPSRSEQELGDGDHAAEAAPDHSHKEGASDDQHEIQHSVHVDEGQSIQGEHKEADEVVNSPSPVDESADDAEGLQPNMPEIMETAASEHTYNSEDNLSTDSLIIHDDVTRTEDEQPIGDKENSATAVPGDENGNMNAEQSMTTSIYQTSTTEYSHEDIGDHMEAGSDIESQSPAIDVSADQPMVTEEDYYDEDGTLIHKKTTYQENTDEQGNTYYHQTQSETRTKLVHAGSTSPESEREEISPAVSPTPLEQSSI